MVADVRDGYALNELNEDVLDDDNEDTPIEIGDLLPVDSFCEVVVEEDLDDVDSDVLGEAMSEDYQTMPEAVKANL